MEELRVQDKIFKVIYNLDGNGTVVPAISFLKPIQLGPYDYNNIWVNSFKDINTTTLGSGDLVEFDLPFERPEGSSLRLIQAAPGNTQDRMDVYPTYCPYCRTPLATPAPTAGNFRRCINRACMMQVRNYSKLMVEAIGFNADPKVTSILNLTYMRTTMHYPDEIFFAEPPAELTGHDKAIIDEYKRYMYELRSQVTVSKFIKALSLPLWCDETFQLLENYANANQWKLSDIIKFTELQHMTKLPQVNWGPWLEFIQLPSNVYYMRRLAADFENPDEIKTLRDAYTLVSCK